MPRFRSKPTKCDENHDGEVGECSKILSNLNIVEDEEGESVDESFEVQNTHPSTKGQKFACDFQGCQTICVTKGKLIRHKITHLSKEEKHLNMPYACTVDGCNTRCMYESGIVRHMQLHIDERNFTCEFENCGKSFNLESILKNHVKIHDNIKSFKCEECASTFITISRLKDHMKSHSQVREFICDIGDCKFAFKTKRYLTEHIRIHNNDRKYICDYDGCQQSFVQMSVYQRHQQTHTNLKPWVCDFTDCYREFADLKSLKKHELRKHVEQEAIDLSSIILEFKADPKPKPEPISYVCDFESCRKLFTSLGHLNAHKRCHKTERAFACEVEGCDKKFKTGSNLRDHLQSHQAPTFECDYEDCDKIYIHQSALKNHKLTHEGIRPFKCDQCDLTFTQTGHLTSHKYTHDKSSFPYTCSECNKGFNQTSTLNIHMRTHTNLKPYACTFDKCDYVCASSGALTAHMEVHKENRDRKYVCDIGNCKKSYLNREMLAYHKKSHETVRIRPFVCDFEKCGKAFIQSIHLKSHKNIHFNHRPYVCDHCAQAFHNAGTLTIHRRMHTGELPYICTYPLCDQKFDSASRLSDHTKRFHSEAGIKQHKIEETRIENLLKKSSIKHVREHRIEFSCLDSQAAYARVDFLILQRGHIIILEVDEGQHNYGDYSVSCDMSRMARITESLALDGNTLPIVFIRYNPHAMHIENELVKVDKKLREAKLVETINGIGIGSNSDILPLRIYYMYYDCIVDEESDEGLTLCVHSNPAYNDLMKECCLPPIT